MGLSYFIDDGVRVHDVTRHVERPSFTLAAPGGYGPASATVRLPLETFADLGPADRWWVTDDLGTVLHEGFTTRPRPTEDGEQTFDLSVNGTEILASDQQRALPYLESSVDGFVRSSDLASTKTALLQTSVDEDTGKAAFTCGFPQGSVTQGGSRARATDYGLIDAGLTIGAVRYTVKAGENAGAINYRMESPMRDAAGVFVDTEVSIPLTTTPQTVELEAGTDFDPSGASLSLQLRQSGGGATNVTSDNVWADYYDLTIAMARVNALGFPTQVPAISVVFLLDIVADLIGRMLPLVESGVAVADDGGTGRILERISYREPVTARQVLDDLLVVAPDLFWRITDRVSSGKYRFEFKPWPTRPRYTIDSRDDPQIDGDTGGDLCNRQVVQWTDAQGSPQSTRRTTVVPELVYDGVTRWVDADLIVLPDGMGSLSLAIEVADAALAVRNAAPSAGTAVVSRLILDELTGEWVEPWHIKPGELVRVRESGTTARLTEVVVDGEGGSAAVTFGQPPRSTDEIVNDLTNNRSIR